MTKIEQTLGILGCLFGNVDLQLKQTYLKVHNMVIDIPLENSSPGIAVLCPWQSGLTVLRHAST